MTQWKALSAVAKWVGGIAASLFLLAVAASGNYVKDNREKAVANKMSVELVKQKVDSNRTLVETRLQTMADEVRSQRDELKESADKINDRLDRVVELLGGRQ